MADPHPPHAVHEPCRTRQGLGRAVDVLGALAAALLACTAVPAVLVLAVGNPLSGGLGHTWQPAWRDILCVAVLVAWIAWAGCCIQLARAVAMHVRRGGDMVASTTVVDRLAARIAVGVLALSSLGGPLALSATAGAVVAPPHPAALLETRPLDVSVRASSLAPPPTTPDPAAAEALWYTVRRGDSLWSIADTQVDDGADWTAIAALNFGRDVGDGRRFVDPVHIEAGWRLRLPAANSSTSRESRTEPRHHQSRASGRHDTPGPPNRLPEIAALGMGSLVCAGLARRARWRRRPPPFSEDPDVARLLSDGAVDTAALLHRFAGVPALTSFETANRLLGWSLDGRVPAPALRAASVSVRGVTFWLPGRSDEDLPEGFAAAENGQGWHIGHDGLTDAAGQYPDRASHPPFAPLALPVGDDDEGTWLVVVQPGQVLPVLGPAAPALVRSMRSATGAWDWSDGLLATDDPADPALVADAGADHAVGHRLVYFGDPARLPAGLAPHVAIVTTSTAAASDLTVLVDRHGATIHPLGRVVRPFLQTEETARSVQDLLSVAPRPEPEPDLGATGGRPLRGGTGTRRHPVRGTEAFTPGTVDVRLLTMTPRLDGLREELPPNRVRRAVELVSYLALHSPDVITSDRLRTRVLGSADADAASKTLFNVAHAARRALGSDGEGAPLLPPGTRSGLYQISPDVTVDVVRATALAAEGGRYAEDTAEGDAGLAVAFFRAALELVEGEPLANALSGYTWWEAEGHGARISAVLVDAACTLATLAVDQERFELARWGLGRARLVAPYNEALSRAAMRLAAAEGDADRLRLEWDECQRRVDELDPGCSPSPRTESLYGELRRQVHVRHRDPDTGELRPGPERPRYVPATSD